MLSRTAPAIGVLEQAAQSIPGWTPLDQLIVLFNLGFASSHLGGDIIEIGSWCGRTAVALGLAARLTGGTRVHCIDLFPERDDWKQNPDGTYSMEVHLGDLRVGAYDVQTVWKEPFERDIAPLYRDHIGILDIFRSTIASHGLEDVVKYYRSTSAVIASQLATSVRCRLAFVDGDHGYEAVLADIANVETCLLPGGWICFDDAFTSYEGVNRAIQEAVIDNPKYDLKQQLTRKLFAARRRVEQ